VDQSARRGEARTRCRPSTLPTSRGTSLRAPSGDNDGLRALITHRSLKSCFSRRVERCEQISQYRPRQRPNPECFALPPGLIGRSRREASPFAKSGGDHCGVGADLAGEDLVEQVWAPAFEPSQRRRSGRADGAKTVDIAFRVINGFWSSWGAAVLAVGVEDLADPNDRLWRPGSLSRMDYRGPRPAALEGPPLVVRSPFFLRRRFGSPQHGHRRWASPWCVGGRRGLAGSCPGLAAALMDVDHARRSLTSRIREVRQEAPSARAALRFGDPGTRREQSELAVLEDRSQQSVEQPRSGVDLGQAVEPARMEANPASSRKEVVRDMEPGVN